MKKVPKKYTPSLSARFICLDRDDLDEIIAILQDVGSVRILSGDYEFDDFEELQNKFGNKPPDLTILMNYKDSPKDIFEKKFSLEFSKHHAPYVSYSHETTDWYRQTLDVLSKKTDRILEFFESTPGFSILSISIVVFAGTSAGIDILESNTVWPLAVSLYSFVLIFFYVGYRTLRKPWLINLNYRHQPKFWDRHKEKVFWIILGSLVTAAVHFLFKKFFS